MAKVCTGACLWPRKYRLVEAWKVKGGAQVRIDWTSRSSCCFRNSWHHVAGHGFRIFRFLRRESSTSAPTPTEHVRLPTSDTTPICMTAKYLFNMAQGTSKVLEGIFGEANSSPKIFLPDRVPYVFSHQQTPEPVICPSPARSATQIRRVKGLRSSAS